MRCQPVGGGDRQHRDGHQDDAEGGGRSLVRRSGPLEEAEDRDGQRRPIASRKEDRRSELTEGDRERQAEMLNRTGKISDYLH